MKIAGIIAEYNPFHTGHAWHIEQTRRATGCDYVVVCMGGHFTQRGEPAMLSKWARAEMALRCGADAVFELPALFAVRTADAFARGGVAILGGLGCDALSFGCETTDMELIRAIARVGQQEPEAVSLATRERLDAGCAHARARGEAVAEYLGVSPALVGSPNLILAAEYVRWIDALGVSMIPVAVARVGEYHDERMGEFASATAIRAAFARLDVDAALRYIPEPARSLAKPDAMHPMDDLLMYRLREMTLEDLKALPDVTEGLEQRLCRLCRETATRQELLDALKCKRYTHARLSRLLTHALLGLTQSMADANPMPDCARLLGMRADAGPLLSALNARTGIPIASSASRIRQSPQFQFECRATDIWSLLHDAPKERLPGRELTERFITVR